MQIGLEDLLVLFRGVFSEAAADVGAADVDEDVVVGMGGSGVDGGIVSDVQENGICLKTQGLERIGFVLQSFYRAGGERSMGTIGGKSASNGEPNSTAGAGDEGALAGQGEGGRAEQKGRVGRGEGGH